MSVLLMRLSGPMQAWGVQSRFGVRDTTREPSKSGVVGLLAAALGRPRDAAIDDLAALRMGVRVDREGTLLRDYHTAQEVYRAKGGIKPTELSTRYYLERCLLFGWPGRDCRTVANPARCAAGSGLVALPGPARLSAGRVDLACRWPAEWDSVGNIDDVSVAENRAKHPSAGANGDRRSWRQRDTAGSTTVLCATTLCAAPRVQ